MWAALGALAVSVLHAVTDFGGSPLGRPLEFAAILCAAAGCLLMLFDNRRLIADLRHEARTDTLTGLGNRERLMDDLEAALEKHRPYVFALFDLDGFKAYNDSFGHPAGDSLLCKLAANLAGTVERDHGYAYRLGGDEFCILVPAKSAGGEPIAAASAALSEQGTGFSVRTS